jgi:outer membrane beta-barrel protein
MTIWFASLSILFTVPSYAAEQDGAQKVKSDRVNVDLLKQKYWAQGEESELQVVQNRKFKKKGTLEVGLQLGSSSTDPFLVVKDIGFRIGYNFNEDFGISAFLWRVIATPSEAYTQLESTTTARANVNSPSMFYAAEASYSPIYGKLSILGKAIIYYDMKVTGGIGSMQTDTGAYLAPMLGVGQKIFLRHDISLAFDYRFIFFNETVTNRNPTGPSSITRTNYTHAIMIGVDYLFSFN